MQAIKMANMVEYDNIHHAAAHKPKKGATVAAISKLLRYVHGRRYSVNMRAQSWAFLSSITASLPLVLNCRDPSNQERSYQIYVEAATELIADWRK